MSTQWKDFQAQQYRQCLQLQVNPVKSNHQTTNLVQCNVLLLAQLM